MREVKLQTLLCLQAQEEGGHAFKMSNQFVKGISDLSVKMPRVPHCYVEVKKGRSEQMTEHQKAFIARHLDAGGYAGWVRIWPGTRRGEYHLLVDRGTHMTKHNDAHIAGQYLIKEHGKPWPIRSVVEYITHSKIAGTQ